MKPSILLAETVTPDGGRLTLHTRDGHYDLRLDGRGLMSTFSSGSEERLAEVGCEKLAHARPRILIGGLGLGCTLRRVLAHSPAGARVQVAELLAEVVAWNRAHLQHVNGGLLDDPRVEVLVDNVVAVIAHADPGAYDAIILDVDNGASAWVDSGNVRLYSDAGLRALSRALRPGGRAVFWATTADRAFVSHLRAFGFRSALVRAKTHAQAKRTTHNLVVADRAG